MQETYVARERWLQGTIGNPIRPRFKGVVLLLFELLSSCFHTSAQRQ
jgi:hypothetical protein